MLYVTGWDGMDGRMDGMVIIGHRSSKNTIGANNPCLLFSNIFKRAHQEQHEILQSSRKMLWKTSFIY